VRLEDCLKALEQGDDSTKATAKARIQASSTFPSLGASAVIDTIATATMLLHMVEWEGSICRLRNVQEVRVYVWGGGQGGGGTKHKVLCCAMTGLQVDTSSKLQNGSA